MTPDERKELVLRNTAEVITDDELDDVIRKDDPVAYIGYAPTGMMHIGHFTTIRKIADFVNAGFTFKILIADVHAELDVEKTPLDLVDARSTYYRKAIEGMLDAAGVEDGVEFVLGSDYQHETEYQKGYMHQMENATVTRAQRSVNEVVRHEESMKASGILYTFMQIQDTVALDVDVAYAGLDQRRIYMLGREVLPRTGEDKPTCVFAPLLSGLTGGKMSASDAQSKISIHDDEGAVKKKIGDAYCPSGEVEDNGVLEYARYLVFPLLEVRDEPFTIERPDEYGGDVSFDSYDELEQQYVEGEIHPQDLKNAVAASISRFLQPIQDRFEGEDELLRTAYPDEYGE
jgi:tyrosyl-tRNA synthetase